MNQEYIDNALRTDLSPEQYDESAKRLSEHIELTHAIMGIITEGAEMLDILKKHTFYGKPFDHEHMAEEIGDKFWYLAKACSVLKRDYNIDVQTILNNNISKLQIRYPHRFSNEDAIQRKDMS